MNKTINSPDSFTSAHQALTALLEEFRTDGFRRCVGMAVDRHSNLEPLTRRWDAQFPGFPESNFAYASLRGLKKRGRRDRYLRSQIIRQLGSTSFAGQRMVMNPVCVFGRHARLLAIALPKFRVIASDINPWFFRLYRGLHLGRIPKNCEFRREDIFHPSRKDHAVPAAVVFFGACGSLSDAAMDYALRVRASYLFCRTCCHDNIGGNTTIEPDTSLLNRAFRAKNRVYARKRASKSEEYFSDRYNLGRYPRSRAARMISTSEEFLEVSRHSVGNDICRSIVDLDRCLHLAECGYEVFYRGELFIAKRLS